MTEPEWLACKDLGSKLDALDDRTTPRKLRLFCCACSRTIWPLLREQECRSAILLSERFADGAATEQEVGTAVDQLNELFKDADAESNSEEEDESREGGMRGMRYAAVLDCLNDPVWPLGASSKLIIVAEDEEMHTGEEGKHTGLREAHRRILDDVIGPSPFWAMTIDPAWLTETVVGLASGIYESRAFERMPILADALQDAGCEHPDILSHCREPGEHVLGCWVVDLLLGRE